MLNLNKQRTRWFILAALVCLGAFGTILLTRRSEPRTPQPAYAGRSFDVWLSEVSTVPDDTDPAVEAIRQMGVPALPWLLQALVDGKTAKRGQLQAWAIQDRAAEVLIALGPAAAPIASELLPHLNSKDKRLRSHVAEIFGRMDFASSEVIENLVKLLADDDVAYEAALSLGQLGRNHTNVLPRLMVSAQTGSPKIEEWATVSMEKIGPKAAPALPLLTKLLASRSFGTRVAAAKTIGLIGPSAALAVPALTNALADSEPWVRKCAAIALGRIGPNAREAIAALRLRSAREDYEYAQSDIARALWRIDRGQLDVVLRLSESILTNNFEVARQEGTLPYAATSAIDLLGELGTNATHALASITNLIDAEDPVLSFNAAWATWRIAPGLRPLAESTLERLLALERYPADSSLANGGPVGQVLVEPKRQRESYHIRLAAAGALWQTGFKDKNGLQSFLGKMLRTWSHWTSMKSVIPETHALVPALNELLAEPTLVELHPFFAKARSDIEGPDGERW